MLYLSSTQNGLIKKLKALQTKAKTRKTENAFVIEGFKEIDHAINGGYHIENLFLKEGEDENPFLHQISETKHITVSPALFEQICYRKTSKAIAIAACKNHSLDNYQTKEACPFFLVAEAPEKPGNIGALLRTADAMGVDCFVLVDPKTDLYNPNVVRSSVGCLFSVQVVTTTLEGAFEYFNKHKIPVYSAALTEEAQLYTAFDFTQPTAIAVGTESEGLSATWLAQNSTPIIIPMLGQNDSLNVSVAAGIILAEVQRQRNPS